MKPNTKNRLRLALNFFTAYKRATPDFVIIGSSKSGTSNLYRYLQEHPQLKASHPYKEIGYFARRYHRGPLWYRANFPVREPGKLYYEATPSYIVHPEAAHRMHAFNPAMKLIASFRHPIERAFSNYQHAHRNGSRRAQAPFDEIVTEEVRNYDPARYDTSKTSKVHFGWVHPGLYLQHLKAWLELFPREQIHIIISDDLFAEPQATMDGIYDFLGVARIQHDAFPNVNKGNYSGSMKPETLELLREFYRPHNEALFQFLGRRYDWD